jgi:hypothetical protein
MFLNIIYYDRMNESQQVNNSTMSWTLGPVRISIQQVCLFVRLRLQVRIEPTHSDFDWYHCRSINVASESIGC